MSPVNVNACGRVVASWPPAATVSTIMFYSLSNCHELLLLSQMSPQPLTYAALDFGVSPEIVSAALEAQKTVLAPNWPWKRV